MKHVSVCCYCFLMIFLSACTSSVQVRTRWQKSSPLAQEYAGVVLPYNIAPLNFFIPSVGNKEAVVLTYGEHRLTVFCREGACVPDLKEWKKLLADAKGQQIGVEHCVQTEEGEWAAYQKFMINVAEEPIDPYVAYRLIPPGYEVWNEMGIYQRNLENFEEKAVLTNRQTGHNCMNCHSFCMQSPDNMLLHLRGKHAGTLLTVQGKVVKLDTKTNWTISSLVYPYWHPEGNFIACSVNDTKQFFHTHHVNRIEVLDYKSDVVVYDVRRNELFTAPALFDEECMETFPTFSADGKKLYFCTAPVKPMPDHYDKVRYHLCSIDFDAEHRTFGEQVDTLYQAEANGKSVSFPRVSPDGRYLLMTLSDFGNFSIWHQEADLWMIDLKNNILQKMDEWNSDSVESYHSWSSNSRWVIFSSRRGDGLYTRLYIAYLDKNGKASKPFVLPQKRGRFYQRFMYSYNIPELLKGPVETENRQLVRSALDEETLKIKMEDPR